MRSTVVGLALVAVLGGAGQVTSPAGVRLGERTWADAEKLLRTDSIVVIPIGAALQQHGPHLPLRSDLVLAEHFADRLASAASVVVAPPVTYHLYPASLEYPGSTSLTPETARDVIVQIARTLARPGPRRFYAVATGLHQGETLTAAAQVLARDGILLRSLDFAAEVERLAAGWKQQSGGAHADELETSMLLFVDPQSVDMKQAVKEFAPWSGPLTRSRGAPGTFSSTGTWGDATLATREKGQYLVDGLTGSMLQGIEALRSARLPAAQAGPSSTSGAAPSSVPRTIGPTRVFECPSGVERDIKRVEAAFHLHWANRDAESLAMLWADQGDLVHPDGRIEKGRRTIYEHRLEQFRAPEYRAARHSLAFGIIRCINESTAVVDARWTLRDVTDLSGAVLPASDGAATLVLQRAGDNWPIEAYRYHLKPGSPPGPIWQKRPGLPDKR
jgi:creatinine amidohydrolase